MTLPLDMPAHFHHAPSFAQVRAELARELDQRRRFTPDRVAKGRLSQDQADHQIAVFAAIAQDLEAVIAIRVPQLVTGGPLSGRADWEGHSAAGPNISTGTPLTTLSWSEKRNALNRELDYRRRFYPDWIAKGRLAQGAAQHQLACLASCLALYDDGLTWQPNPAHAEPVEARQQWRDLAATLTAQAEPAKELAL